MKSRLREWSIESIHSLFIPAWNQMSVTVHRDLDGGVTQLFFHIHRAFSLLKKQRGEAVAEIMETYLS